MSDWHPEDIKSAVRKRGKTLSDIARESGLSGGALRLALSKPRLKAEAAIARFLDVHPMVIWPSRYDPTGARKCPQPVDNYRADARFDSPTRKLKSEPSRFGANAPANGAKLPC